VPSAVFHVAERSVPVYRGGVSAAPLSGRRKQAARNDGIILEAARAVFVADPTAPIAAVAERAGVGISALYRRHGSKEDLLRRLCADGLATYIAIAEETLGDDGDPWEVFAEFMRRVVEADTHSLTLSLAGTFTPTPELYEAATRVSGLVTAVVERAHEAGVLRRDVAPTDFGVLFMQIASIKVPEDEERTRELRRRYLSLMLDSLRPPGNPLPVGPPRPGEFARMWEPANA
jgi:AcrR family transcriptional regulator